MAVSVVLCDRCVEAWMCSGFAAVAASLHIRSNGEMNGWPVRLRATKQAERVGNWSRRLIRVIALKQHNSDGYRPGRTLAVLGDNKETA